MQIIAPASYAETYLQSAKEAFSLNGSESFGKKIYVISAQKLSSLLLAIAGVFEAVITTLVIPTVYVLMPVAPKKWSWVHENAPLKRLYSSLYATKDAALSIATNWKKELQNESANSTLNPKKKEIDAFPFDTKLSPQDARKVALITGVVAVAITCLYLWGPTFSDVAEWLKSEPISEPVPEPINSPPVVEGPVQVDSLARDYIKDFRATVVGIVLVMGLIQKASEYPFFHNLSLVRK